MTAIGGITVHAPEGTPWEFLVLFAVIVLGPAVVQRARVPGLVGLLVGGFVIGPNGLGWIEAGNTTIPELGAIGLLYLMFVAGVELDLGLLKTYRRSAVLFGLTTFLVPMALGAATGLALGWGLAAALLLGSLLASHTLVLYPMIRNAGLGADPTVAAVLGATVLTDTLALIVLAAVAGSETDGGSGAEIAIQVGLGLAVLGAFCFLVLPRLARAGFRLLGADRAVRYAIAIAAFLSAALVGEMFGIEGIVGAFFAGLALNRLVPNRGPTMDRIDFFGNAVFVPVFLVSIGLLLEPSVMVEGETLGLAALLVAACLGGKLIAAAIARPLMGASGAQMGVIFALTSPQAAATLAATTVGYDIGLFGETVVNAVLVLILVSVTVATLVAERAKERVPAPSAARRNLGEHVLAAVEDPERSRLALRAAAAVAAPIGGTVAVVLLEQLESAGSDGDLALLKRRCAEEGLESEPTRLVTGRFAEGVVGAALAIDATLIVAVEREVRAANIVGGWAETVATVGTAPVALVRGAVDEIGEVHLASGDGDRAADGVAQQLAEALGGAGLPVEAKQAQGWPSGMAAGSVTVAPLDSWAQIDGVEPPAGAGLLLIPGPVPVAPATPDDP